MYIIGKKSELTNQSAGFRIFFNLRPSNAVKYVILLAIALLLYINGPHPAHRHPRQHQHTLSLKARCEHRILDLSRHDLQVRKKDKSPESFNDVEVDG